MNFSLLPPEINSALMYGGAGSAPMLQASVAWEGLAAELASAAASFGSVTSGLVSGSWQGPASAAMTGAAAPYVSWLNAVAAGAQGVSAQAKAAVAVFESALAATVHPAVVAVNRTRLVQLVTSNWLGLNAPAIAATEAHYEQIMGPGRGRDVQLSRRGVGGSRAVDTVAGCSAKPAGLDQPGK